MPLLPIIIIIIVVLIIIIICHRIIIILSFSRRLSVDVGVIAIIVFTWLLYTVAAIYVVLMLDHLDLSSLYERKNAE